MFISVCVIGTIGKRHAHYHPVQREFTGKRYQTRINTVLRRYVEAQESVNARR